MLLYERRFRGLECKLLRGMWVLFRILLCESKEAFRRKCGVRSLVIGNSTSFSRYLSLVVAYVRVKIEGVPLNLWTLNISKELSPGGVEVYWIRAKEVPGWTPDLVEDSDEEELSNDDSLEEGMKNLESENDCSNSFEVLDTVFENEGDNKSVNDFEEEKLNVDDGDSTIPTQKKNRLCSSLISVINVCFGTYLAHVINLWQGEVVDYEASMRSERSSSWGSAFTWCNKLRPNEHDRFAKPSERRANIDMRFPKTISEDQSQDLEREVSKQEIKTTVWGCGTDKSSGLDGFSFGLYGVFGLVIEPRFAYVILKGFILCQWQCPTNEFQFYKGLKQGDPLSPFLFILVMESLHLSFQMIVNAGMFKGIVLDQSLCLSHMFYADDAIFLGEWSDGNISTLIHDVRFKCLSTTLGTSSGRFYAVFKMQEIVINSEVSAFQMDSILSFHMSIFNVPSKVLHILESVEVISLMAMIRVIEADDLMGFGSCAAKTTTIWTKVIDGHIHGVGGKIHSERLLWQIMLAFDLMKFDLSKKGAFLKNIFPRLKRLNPKRMFTSLCQIGDTEFVCSFRRIPRGGGIEKNQFRHLGRIGSFCHIRPSADRWNWKSGVYGPDALPTRFANISREGIDFLIKLVELGIGGSLTLGR
ncbi:hypothetical protein Tco_1483253 [Tanacetum coccineum]